MEVLPHHVFKAKKSKIYLVYNTINDSKITRFDSKMKRPQKGTEIAQQRQGISSPASCPHKVGAAPPPGQKIDFFISFRPWGLH